jgi:hypothetical protein
MSAFEMDYLKGYRLVFFGNRPFPKPLDLSTNHGLMSHLASCTRLKRSVTYIRMLAYLVKVK